MAESNFQFATTPLRSESQPENADGGVSPDEPTVKSVENIQSFIRKCQSMNVDSDEYHYMRMLVLFNSSEYCYSFIFFRFCVYIWYIFVY